MVNFTIHIHLGRVVQLSMPICQWYTLCSNILYYEQLNFLDSQEKGENSEDGNPQDSHGSHSPVYHWPPSN